MPERLGVRGREGVGMAEDKRIGSGVGSLVGKAISLLVKSAKLLKVGLAAASFAAYAYVWTWQFAAVIMFALFVHESGHVWAMKRVGIPTKGFFFIPFIGGAAVPAGAMVTRENEAFVSLLGPLWGIASAVAIGAIYPLTHDPLFAGAASWIAFINLLNLLPVLPLDGGRLMRAIVFSSRSGSSFCMGLGATLFFAGLAGVAGFGLVMVFGVIGVIDLCVQYWGRDQLPTPMDATARVRWGATYLAIGTALIALMGLCQSVPGADVAFAAIR